VALTRGSEEAEDDRDIKMKGDGWDMEIRGSKPYHSAG